MNIEALEFFKLVVESGSISKVANNSHISQSALSQMIQKVEDTLGYELLVRSNKGVIATDMGKIVIKYADNILKNYEKMLEELRNLEKNNDTVRIHALWSLVNYSLPCILYQIKKDHKDQRYSLKSSSNEDIIRDVINDICDIGFVSEKIEEKDIFSKFIGKEKIVLVACGNCKVKEKISFEELFSHEMVMLKDASNISDRLENKLKEKGKDYFDLNVVFEVDSISAVKSSVENNFGISFLPYMSVKKELYEKKYKIIEIEDLDMDYDIYLISKKQEILGNSVRNAIKTILSLGKEGFC